MAGTINSAPDVRRVLQNCIPHFDENMFFAEKEELVCFNSLYDHLSESKVLQEPHMQEVAAFVARFHHATQPSQIGIQGIGKLSDELVSSQLNKSEEIFVRPYNKDEAYNICTDAVKRHFPLIFEDEHLLQNIGKLKEIYSSRKECLIHGNLNTRAVFIKDNIVKLHDLSSAHIGPLTFDIGVLIAHLIFSYYQHMSKHENHDAHRQYAQTVIDTIRLVVAAYVQHFENESEENVETMLGEIAGFAGCEIIRRIIGSSKCPEIHGIQYVEEDCLQCGVRLVHGYKNVTSADRLVVISFMLCY